MIGRKLIAKTFADCRDAFYITLVVYDLQIPFLTRVTTTKCAKNLCRESRYLVVFFSLLLPLMMMIMMLLKTPLTLGH